MPLNWIRLVLTTGVLAAIMPRCPAQPPSGRIGLFPELIIEGEPDPPPLFSMEVNGQVILSDEFHAQTDNFFEHPLLGIEVSFSELTEDPTVVGIPAEASVHSRLIRFRNRSGDTLEVANLVPLGISDDRPRITGYGPPGLTRATLFRPGSGPVGLIVPDNAWELGWSARRLSDEGGISILARREGTSGAQRRRYSTVLFPGGEVAYRIHTEPYRGGWKEALLQVFRERWLYDMKEFDNMLYNRKDLQWIREDYLTVLQFAWDRDFYSPEDGTYSPFREFFHRFDPLHGGYDIYGLWQGWPRLGLDSRNQWDLLRDLPGGIDSIRALSRFCRKNGTAFFISYNPWDESTRPVDHLEALTETIRETEASGVVLDTRGSSSRELQQAADRAREGVVMYSEGMAVPRDMPGIISGRVHNAILMSPPLNMNRLIKPEFQVFRVLDLRDGRLHREMAIALFNGYGAELNLFSPAHPWWLEEEYRYMGRCLMILRQNGEAFHDLHWNPLVEAPDSIWVNEWHSGEKTLFTVLSLKPSGHSGPLLRLDQSDLHWISLWDHEEIIPEAYTGNIPGEPAQNSPGVVLEARVDPFPPSFYGTRREGSVQVIAGFPVLLRWELTDRSLHLSAVGGDHLQLWKGDPSYGNPHTTRFKLDSEKQITVPLSEWGFLPEGKLVVQLFEGKELIDEQIIHSPLAMPVRIDSPRATEKCERIPEGMVEVTGAPFAFCRGNDADFIPYPHNFDTLHVEVVDFLMDRYPVTNRQFSEFLQATGYHPSDTTHFLMHWHNGSFPDSLADHPVVWVSLEDARSYARWKGGRLPTEMEWQYAAQGTDGREWPWGSEMDTTLCNYSSGRTTAVQEHPGGRSPFGVEDMVGNVWQLCEDEYFDGTFAFSIIRGGSFYHPTSSWWYIQGGPQPNNHTQMLLKTAPGFDRSETVGFRCVCDR